VFTRIEELLDAQASEGPALKIVASPAQVQQH
jgi:hypothetical protein